MLSLVPSLRLLPALQCPRCGQLLVQSGREDEHVYCPECEYSVGKPLRQNQRFSECPQISDASEYD